MKFSQDAVAFVSGAGSGLGRATALAFSREGVRVLAADVDLRAAEETAHQCRGAAALPWQLDVTREAEVLAAIATIDREWGRLDYAVNSAGIRGTTDEAYEVTEEAFRQVMNVNVLGTFLCLREELKRMVARGAGAVVNMASTSAFVTTPRSLHYTASKHAVMGLTKSAAFDVAASGVRVNAVAPGTIETPMNVRLSGGEEEMRKRYTAAYPIGRLGKPDEVAEAVLWLCEDRASFVTGHTLVLDGGMLLR